MTTKLYMSNEQVEQVFDTHAAWLDRQLNRGNLNQQVHQEEMRELTKWARRNYH